MLTNAAITRIDRRDGHDATGRPLIVQGDALASGGARCFVDGLTSRQRYALGAMIEDADLTCYVKRSALLGEAAPDDGDRLTLLADGAPGSYEADVITVIDRRLPRGGGNTHLEIYLRRRSA